MLLRLQKHGKYLALSLALQCHLRGITYLVNLFLVLKNPRNGSENRVPLNPLANDRHQELNGNLGLYVPISRNTQVVHIPIFPRHYFL